ncbi:conserved hypothetical protein [Ricinus communis]|uniref:Uncharacterized protein n=1 Tax=Ricinus communis TaxID=3988 RepID=B9TB75_RICCO|nr:conserved hypothetical protein [Ricinus communis]
MIFLLLLAPTRRGRRGPKFRLRRASPSRPMGLWPKRLGSKQSVGPSRQICPVNIPTKTSRWVLVRGPFRSTLAWALVKRHMLMIRRCLPTTLLKFELGLGSIDLPRTVPAQDTVLV